MRPIPSSVQDELVCPGIEVKKIDLRPPCSIGVEEFLRPARHHIQRIGETIRAWRGNRFFADHTESGQVHFGNRTAAGVDDIQSIARRSHGHVGGIQIEGDFRKDGAVGWIERQQRARHRAIRHVQSIDLGPAIIRQQFVDDPAR